MLYLQINHTSKYPIPPNELTSIYNVRFPIFVKKIHPQYQYIMYFLEMFELPTHTLQFCWAKRHDPPIRNQLLILKYENRWNLLYIELNNFPAKEHILFKFSLIWIH